MTAMMQAVQFSKAGGPEVLQIRTVPRPSPKAGEVLVRVRASGVNPADAKMRRLRFGKFPRGTGMDFAGEVVETGSGVDGLQPGQRVWGYLGTGMRRTGAAAEYVVAPLKQVALLPSLLDFPGAAALPTVGLTALQALRRGLHLQAGERLLVIGASGGVGSAAVQIASAMGARVTAVASARNADFCRDLGAEHVLDYRAPIENAPVRDFDAFFDCNGAALGSYRRLLRKGGRGATVAFEKFHIALLSYLSFDRHIRPVMVSPRPGDLDALAQYVQRGELRPIIEEILPLISIQEAHRAVEAGHARGKRVLAI